MHYVFSFTQPCIVYVISSVHHCHDSRAMFSVQLITDFKLLEKVVKAFTDNNHDQQLVAF